MGKYEPLPQFLEQKGVGEIRLNFAQIEKALGFKLPKSAYQHQAWWANHASTHSHARAWLRAGWQTKDVDLGAHKVTFRKTRSSAAPLAAPAAKRQSIFGCLTGTVTVMPGADLTAPGDDVWNAEEGILLNE